MTQYTGEGGFSDKSTVCARVEGIGRCARDMDRVVEYLFGADRGFGGGALRASARECWVGITQETNIIDGIHMRYGTGYLVWEMKAESRHRAGVRWCGGRRWDDMSRGWITLVLTW